MTVYHSDSDKYGQHAQFAIVDAYHGAIKQLVRSHLVESGERWQDFVFGTAETVTNAVAFADIERQLVALGHRFEWSALISQQERPDVYLAAQELVARDPNFSFDHPQAPHEAPQEGGRRFCGFGDNVVGYADDIIGTARYVRSIARVLEYLTNGVPENTIAVIDDSGGTLTAPILEQFSGVICAGGTVRSHLGILTREYGIPCLMNAKLAGIFEGDEVVLESSAAAKTAEAYQQGIEMTAKIWRLEKSAT